MGKYASETTVPVEKSRAEIEATLVRYGASEFHTGWQQEKAMIAFRIGELFIRFILPIPPRNERRFTHKKDRYGYESMRTDIQADAAYQQEVKQRWRALLLTVKAKLEAVECGISTLEQEFLAFIVMPNNLSLGDWIIESALPAIRKGTMPLMIAGPTKTPDEVVDAEIVGRDAT